MPLAISPAPLTRTVAGLPGRSRTCECSGIIAGRGAGVRRERSRASTDISELRQHLAQSIAPVVVQHVRSAGNISTCQGVCNRAVLTDRSQDNLLAVHYLI